MWRLKSDAVTDLTPGICSHVGLKRLIKMACLCFLRGAIIESIDNAETLALVGMELAGHYFRVVKMAARSEVQFCFEGMVNFTEFQAEIEHAKPTGDLDIVFRKYCGKTPHLRGCVSNFTEAIEPCLNPDERILKETIINVTDALISFICFKEGDRIALFIAEEGPECLKSKQEQIQECINSTFSHYIPKDMPGKQEELPLFKMEEKECGDLRKLQKCVIKHLEKCSEPTPANIVDSLIKFVRKMTPCEQFEPVTKSGAGLPTVGGFVLVFSTFIVLASKLQ
ncbi:Interferon- developmental regulator 1 [Homalodisca vitripennis]|nr:Interferon- developmental regulator 1 [Homalodisca vitripennis]